MKRFFKPILFVLIILPVFTGIAFYSGCKDRPKHESHAEEALYQCPMHPHITSPKPGNCPICGMPLVKIESTSGLVNSDHASIVLDAQRRQLIGVETATVETRPLTLTIRTVGQVGYDPDFYDALNEYKEALILQRETKRKSSPNIREKSMDLLRIVEMKLRLAGLSDNQINNLLTYDQSVRQVTLPLDSNWIYADVYEHESELVLPGQKVHLNTPAFPGRHFEGIVRTVDPILNAMTRLVRARIEVEKSEHSLKAGMTVDVEIQIDLGTKLAVPEEAILPSSEHPLVFVDETEGRISPRNVEIGRTADGYVEILSGLQEGERVISSANFLIDSESRLRAAAQSFGAKNQKKQKGGDSAPESQAPPSAGLHQH